MVHRLELSRDCFPLYVVGSAFEGPKAAWKLVCTTDQDPAHVMCSSPTLSPTFLFVEGDVDSRMLTGTYSSGKSDGCC